MNTLFEEQFNSVVEYSGEARIPEIVHGHMHMHHEDLLLDEISTLLGKIGGSITGHGVRHSMGESIDHTQFEIVGKEENV